MNTEIVYWAASFLACTLLAVIIIQYALAFFGRNKTKAAEDKDTNSDGK